MKNWAELKAWAEWRGISIKDLLVMGGSLGFLISVTAFLIYGLIVSLQ
jgi:hypothetical protein